MTHEFALMDTIRAALNRRYVRLVGRGATAFYIALRAVIDLHAISTVIMPDILCKVVYDAALLAGVRPIIAGSVPGRFGLDWARLPSTDRACVLFAHCFGLRTAPALKPGRDIILIEDAVQGLGGAVGTLGDMTFISFDPEKMIGGRGGAIVTDDPALWDAIQAVDFTQPIAPDPYEPDWLRDYRPQLDAMRTDLLRPFDASIGNVALITDGWRTLRENVRLRNEKAAFLCDQCAELPIIQPAITPGDAVWRYPIAVADTRTTNRMLRGLQRAGLRGSSLYTPLSALYPIDSTLDSTAFARRMVNLWVDSATTQADLIKTVAVIKNAVQV